MQGKADFLEQLLSSLNGIIDEIDEREQMESDWIVARELAEQLRDEVESLQE